jgi:hypothetical protein
MQHKQRAFHNAGRCNNNAEILNFLKALIIRGFYNGKIAAAIIWK